MPLRIGLTGNIACGKSTVGALLAARGADYVDADRLVHALMESGTPENAAIVARFGADVRTSEGRIDRGALGARVWSDPVALRDLESILHPGVRKEIRRRLAAATAPIVVIDAIKLIESGLAREMDTVWVVVCSRNEQTRRLAETRGLTAEQAAVRIDAQAPAEEKLRHATTVIDNSGSLADLERQVDVALAAALDAPPALSVERCPGQPGPPLPVAGEAPTPRHGAEGNDMAAPHPESEGRR
ncbi:MAG: dephospho-CoA kinase [Chloroflexi bacterium]|nr:dephospho-CoA kinase [Chloroflexota bacterium]